MTNRDYSWHKSAGIPGKSSINQSVHKIHHLFDPMLSQHFICVNFVHNESKILLDARSCRIKKNNNKNNITHNHKIFLPTFLPHYFLVTVCCGQQMIDNIWKKHKSKIKKLLLSLLPSFKAKVIYISPQFLTYIILHIPTKTVGKTVANWN